MKRSTFFLVVALILSIFAVLKILGIPTFISQAHAQSQEMGAYDIAVIPLEDVPEPGENVYRKTYSDSAWDEYSPVEILRVINDPRDIPLERFLYYKYPASKPSRNSERVDPDVWEERLKLYDVVTHPDADRIIERFANEAPSAVAVYVKVTGNSYENDYEDMDGNVYYKTLYSFDPFLVLDPVRDYDDSLLLDEFDRIVYIGWFPWPSLAVADPYSDLSFPCLPYDDYTSLDPYSIPNIDVEFDPESYLPPQPWYSGDNYIMEDGEIREGWLLCLAPDVPIEDIELVKRFRPFDFSSGEVDTTPYEVVWTSFNVLQMGEWHLVPNQDVIGWNDAPSDRDEEPLRLDETTVYTGDVWISIATALHYDLVPGPHDPKSGPEDIALIQFNFEGMQDLLQQWDHLALSHKMQLIYCEDFSLQNCSSGWQDLKEVKAQGTWVPISSSYHIALPIDIMTFSYTDERNLVPEHYFPGRLPAWFISPQDVSMPLLTTHEICEQIECIPEDVEFLDSLGDPDNHPPEYDGPIPIIPFGESAYGIRIVETHTYNGPYLSTPYDLDLKLRSGIPYRGEDDFDLLVEIETEGYHYLPYEIFLREFTGTILQNPRGSTEIYYDNSGQWPAYYSAYYWSSRLRKGMTNFIILTRLPIGFSFSNYVLLATHRSDGGGPAFRIQ